MLSSKKNIKKKLKVEKNKKNDNFDELSFLSILNKSENKQLEIEVLLQKELNISEELLFFIKKYVNLDSNNSYITATSTNFNINKLKNNTYSSIINFKKINDTRYINKFFESINSKLSKSGLYFGKVETYPNRRKSLLEKYPPIINWIYYIIEVFY